MGKETTFAAVTMAGLVSAGAIVGLQKYVQVFYDKNGDKLASPGFSFTRSVSPSLSLPATHPLRRRLRAAHTTASTTCSRRPRDQRPLIDCRGRGHDLPLHALS